MRWFISWLVTAVLTGFAVAVVLGLDFLVGKEVAWAGPARSALNLPLPNVVQVLGTPAATVLAQTACWIIVRVVLVRVFAYINSEMTSSPRDAEGPGGARKNRRRAQRGQRSIRLFHNPTGWWLAPFAIALNVIVWSARSFELNAVEGYSPPIPVPIWGLSMLYAASLAAAMATPDKAIPVRAKRVADDPELDPLLSTPGDSAEGESPTLGVA